MYTYSGVHVDYPKFLYDLKKFGVSRGAFIRSSNIKARVIRSNGSPVDTHEQKDEVANQHFSRLKRKHLKTDDNPFTQSAFLKRRFRSNRCVPYVNVVIRI